MGGPGSRTRWTCRTRPTRPTLGAPCRTFRTEEELDTLVRPSRRAGQPSDLSDESNLSDESDSSGPPRDAAQGVFLGSVGDADTDRLMPLHIGIVGCSAEGAALCYRTICSEGARLLGPNAHPEVSMHTPSFAGYVDRLERGDLRGVADLMLESARKLAAVGADFLICPDNTIHSAFDLVEPNSPRPWLHIAAVVAEEAAARGYRRVGVMGTQWLADSSVYPDQLAARGLEFARPSEDERREIHRVIMEELVAGAFAPGSVAYLRVVIQHLAEQGCDSVALGCTEIPLVINDGNSRLPTLDSTRLLARAALRRAVQGVTTKP